MKHFAARFFWSFFGAACLCWPAQAVTLAPSATVRTVRGAAWHFPSGKKIPNPPPLKEREPLYSGDVVGTGADGRAALLFSDGAQLRLDHNAAVEITRPEASGGRTNLFRALGGEIWARLRPGNAIRTRTVALGVRGTEILLRVAPDDGTTTLTVIEGEVDFFNEFGRVVVGTAQQSIARPGQAPTNPVTIDNPAFIVEWTLDLSRAALPREKRFGGVPAASEGDALFASRRFAEALAAFDAANKFAPDPALQTRRGWALLELDRVDEAADAFNAGGATEPALAGRAWLELTREQPALAEDFARRALATAQGANEIYEANTALGVAQLRQGKTADAIVALNAARQAMREVPNADSQARAWLALALLARNDQIGALREATAAAQQSPTSPTAQSHLATVQLFTGNAREAESAAQRAAALTPDAPAAQLVLAQSLLARGDADGAARAAARATALDDQSAPAFYLLGLSDAARRDWPHAERNLQKSLQLSPAFLPAASALARVYNTIGRPQRAIALIENLPQGEAPAGEIQGALGEVLYEQGNYRAATTRFGAALQAQPGSALWHDGLARALLYNNQLRGAIEAGQDAVRLAPRVGAYHATLGLAYDFSRLGAQAEREYRLALLDDPQNALALTRLAQKQAGTDLRPVASSFAQAFLNDPGIERRLLRGGVRAELDVLAGTSQEAHFTHRAASDEGRFHAYGFADAINDDLNRAHSDSRLLGAGEFLTYTDGPRANYYAEFNARRTSRDLPGAGLSPDSDDRARFGYGEAQLAARRRYGRNFLWAGVRGNTSRNTTDDPDLNSFVDQRSGLPIARQRFDSHAFAPEIRFDMTRSDRSQWSLGLAQTRTAFDRRRDLIVPVSSGVASGSFEENDRALLGYAHWAGKLNEKFSLAAQLRVQREARDRRAQTLVSGQPPLSGMDSRTRTLILPGLLATYQMNARTALRLSHNQRPTNATEPTFLPLETLLTTQSAALPFGTPDRLRITQLDLEHQTGHGGFLRAFVFDSKARDELIGGADELGFGSGLPAASAPAFVVANWRARGAGARYETPLGGNWFFAGGAAWRQTHADGANRAPYEPRFFGDVAFNYLSPRGNKLGLILRHRGEFFADTTSVLGGARPRFGGQTYVDLLLAHEPSVRGEFFLSLSNLFNRAELQFNGFPTPGRRLIGGYTRRF